MKRTEEVELTVLCLIEQEDRILLQDRVGSDWKGFTLPGGHVERDESFVSAVIREMKEEAGLTIQHPILCGVKQFPIENGRYIVFLYRTNEFEGTLTSSAEGRMHWVCRRELAGCALVKDFEALLRVFDDPTRSEFRYVRTEHGWTVELR